MSVWIGFRKVILFFCIFLFPLSFVYGEERGDNRVIGVFGKVYPILERDAYEEILEKVKRSNFAEKVEKVKKRVKNKLNINFVLGKAREDNVREVRLSYTLPFDIKDNEGKLIYPAGYTFNPLQYVFFPFVLFFFDGTSKKELEYIKQVGLLDRWDVIFIITKGNVQDVEMLLNREVYVADKNILDYFSVKKTPSFVYQKNDYMVVQEIGLYKDK